MKHDDQLKLDVPRQPAMRIAYMGPISLHLLKDEGVDVASTPKGFEYAFGAYLVREYLRFGHSVSVVTLTHRLLSPFEWANERLSIDIVPTRRAYMFCLDVFRRERRQMVAALRRRNPDVIHAQWTYEFAHAALESGFPCLVTARDSPRQILRHKPSGYRLFNKLYGDWLIPRIPHLTAVSPYMRQELLEAYRLRTDPVVIPNGIRPELFQNRDAERPDRPFAFTTVAAWDHRKNPKPLMTAFGSLFGRFPGARLNLIGRGFEPDGPAARWAKAHAGADGMIFLGSLGHHDVMRYLRDHTDVFVHPTLEESFGSSIVEAMSQRVPVIAGRHSGAVPWILDEGRAGMLVDVNCPAALRDAMESMLSDPALRHSFARKGFDRARSVFTLEAVGQRYLALLEQIRSE